jgi:hypothetical protein
VSIFIYPFQKGWAKSTHRGQAFPEAPLSRDLTVTSPGLVPYEPGTLARPRDPVSGLLDPAGPISGAYRPTLIPGPGYHLVFCLYLDVQIN